MGAALFRVLWIANVDASYMKQLLLLQNFEGVCRDVHRAVQIFDRDPAGVPLSGHGVDVLRRSDEFCVPHLADLAKEPRRVARRCPDLFIVLICNDVCCSLCSLILYCLQISVAVFGTHR